MPSLAYSKRKDAYRGPDPSLVTDQLTLLQSVWKEWGAEAFCKYTIWVLRKEPDDEDVRAFWKQKKPRWNKRLVPFAYNRFQIEWEKNHGQNNITLKPRQVGSTVLHVIRRLLLPSILVPGTSSLLVSQTKGYAEQHFGILQRALRYFLCVDPQEPEKNELSVLFHQHLLHTVYGSRHEVVFDQLESRVLVDTAENSEVGQGLPGINHLVTTETARWRHQPEETMANVTEAVTPGGTKDMESTANGMAGYFYEEYQRAREQRSEYQAHFYPWPYANEYTIPNVEQQKQYIGSYDEATAEEKQAIEMFRLTLGQVAWRRKSLIRLRKNFYEKYPEDDITAFLVSGNAFFERAIIRERLLFCRLNVKPVGEGYNGCFKIFKKPIKGRAYILHADVALGREVKPEETDFSYFTVIDELTGQQVAAYRAKLPPEDYAYHIYDAAVYFNGALVSVERNEGGGGGTVLVTLTRQLAYGNIYMHKEWDKEDKEFETPGLPITPRTRILVLNRLAYYLRTEPQLFNDTWLLEECLSFNRNPKTGKPEAVVGSHDDAVFGSAGAHFVRLVRLGGIDPRYMPKEKYGEMAGNEK